MTRIRGHSSCDPATPFSRKFRLLSGIVGAMRCLLLPGAGGPCGARGSRACRTRRGEPRHAASRGRAVHEPGLLVLRTRFLASSPRSLASSRSLIPSIIGTISAGAIRSAAQPIASASVPMRVRGATARSTPPSRGRRHHPCERRQRGGDRDGDAECGEAAARREGSGQHARRWRYAHCRCRRSAPRNPTAAPRLCGSPSPRRWKRSRSRAAESRA